MSVHPAQGLATGASGVRVYRFHEPGEHNVRFHGGVEMIHVHWPNKKNARAIACLGEHCPAESHKMRTTWQGFLAADVWNVVSQRWEPAVAQITPGWYDILAGRNPRGTQWIAQRCVNQWGKEEIVARQVGVFPPEEWRSDIVVRAAVCRVYGNAAIAFGKPPILQQRQILAPSIGEAPPTAPPPKPAEEIEGTPEYLAKLKRDQDAIKAAGGFFAYMKKLNAGNNQ